MLGKFRNYYPQGSLTSELLNIDRGLYIVKVVISIEGKILATALAAAARIEDAEDRARERAIAALGLEALKSELTPTKSAIKTVISNQSEKAKETEPTVNRSTVAYIPTESQAKNTPAVNFSVTQPSTSVAATVVEPEKAREIANSVPLETSWDEVDNPSNDLEIPPEPTIADSSSNSGNLFEGTFDERPATTLEAKESNYPKSVPINQTVQIDFNEIKHKTDIEIQRLGWTQEDGVKFLKSRYGKRTRLHLTDEQLLEFLNYLESQPTPSL